ncbi:MAG TPA: hypothetical protein VJ973_02475 [Christiangramia sp.]|nr:hypothetical protein [Christiangramia sp.]
MKKLNKLQLYGILISISFLIIANLSESTFVDVISGIFVAIGVAMILQWIPFRKTL